MKRPQFTIRDLMLATLYASLSLGSLVWLAALDPFIDSPAALIWMLILSIIFFAGASVGVLFHRTALGGAVALGFAFLAYVVLDIMGLIPRIQSTLPPSISPVPSAGRSSACGGC